MARRRTQTSFAKEVYYILCLVVFIVSALFTLWGPKGFGEMKKAQRELETHRARVNALEISNTDVTVEFINMMTAQRAYQANARVITADDQNFQQLISIKR